MKNEPFVIERTYKAPVSVVWKAITDKSEMENWYFKLADFRPEIGFEFRFSGGPDRDRQYLHICEVTEVVAERKIAYSWRYDGYPGISFVSFELFPEGEMTRLKLTHRGLETFPSENPDFAEENFIAGWTEIIGRSLANHLKSKGKA